MRGGDISGEGVEWCGRREPASSPRNGCMDLWACCACKVHCACVRESARKPVGKPDAGNPHVRFDERGLGNGTAIRVSTRARPRLYRCMLVNFHHTRISVEKVS